MREPEEESGIFFKSYQNPKITHTHTLTHTHTHEERERERERE